MRDIDIVAPILEELHPVTARIYSPYLLPKEHKAPETVTIIPWTRPVHKRTPQEARKAQWLTGTPKAWARPLVTVIRLLMGVDSSTWELMAGCALWFGVIAMMMCGIIAFG